jgi:hypothetical protein|tara:strand:+ start:289 stop:576 length:288 start_codon:yes stop_codon:yes gene_type:complete
MRFIKFRRDANISFYVQADKIELLESSSNTNVHVYANFTNDDLATDRLLITTATDKAQETLDSLGEHISEPRGTAILAVTSDLFRHITGIGIDIQ